MGLVTYQDLVEHVLDFVGTDATVLNRRKARRAVQAAYRDLGKDYRWRYYLQHGRLNTVAAYSTGTVAYDHTGSAFERQLTLTAGTWPAWAAQGVVLLSNVRYEVATRESDNILTLSIHSNPGEDVAAGTAYEIFRDTYLLPSDFQESGELIFANESRVLQHVSPQDWAQLLRSHWSPSTPWAYTFTGDHNYMGGLAIRFFPAPAEAHSIDYLYKRSPRLLRVEGYQAGTVSTTSGDATLTGHGTAWHSGMVGSVVRITSSQVDAPTGDEGGSPPLFERVITEYTSTVSVEMDATVDQSLSQVKYTISDPADIYQDMLTALHRLAEKQIRLLMRMEPIDGEDMAVRSAILDALAADSRSFETKAAGYVPDGRLRLSDMPWDPPS